MTVELHLAMEAVVARVDHMRVRRMRRGGCRGRRGRGYWEVMGHLVRVVVVVEVVLLMVVRVVVDPVDQVEVATADQVVAAAATAVLQATEERQVTVEDPVHPAAVHLTTNLLKKKRGGLNARKGRRF
jgi:hypothetical protein